MSINEQATSRAKFRDQRQILQTSELVVMEYVDGAWKGFSYFYRKERCHLDGEAITMNAEPNTSSFVKFVEEKPVVPSKGSRKQVTEQVECVEPRDELCGHSVGM